MVIQQYRQFHFVRGSCDNADIVSESLYGFVHLADVRYTETLVVLYLLRLCLAKEELSLTGTRMLSQLTAEKAGAVVVMTERISEEWILIESDCGWVTLQPDLKFRHNGRRLQISEILIPHFQQSYRQVCSSSRACIPSLPRVCVDQLPHLS